MFNRLFLFALLLIAGNNLFAQCRITGRITDEAGQPLPGANAIIEGTRQGAVANADGLFVIENVQPGKYVLQVTFVGFAPSSKEMIIENQREIEVNFRLSLQSMKIGELVVTATRAGATTPMTYTNVGKEELQKTNLGQDVPYLLQWSPSTVVTSDAGAGVGYTGIRIRGSDPTRINVTINGIPLNDAESQGVYWVDLPDFASSTHDVQIQRGVGASTNGAGAFGATINLSTAEVQRDAYATLNGSAGSFNTLKKSIRLGSGLIKDKFAFDGRLSNISSDGYIDRARADLNSYYLSGLYLGKKSSLRLNVFSGHEVTYQAWDGVPADYVDDPKLRTFNSAGTEKTGEPYENQVDNYRQTHYQLLYNWQWSPQWAANVSLHYTHGAGYYEQYKADESLADYNIQPPVIEDTMITNSDLIRRLWLDNDFYGVIYALQYAAPSSRFTTTLGGGYNQYDGDHFGEVIWSRYAGNSETGDRYYENNARKRDLNVYVKTNYGITNALNAYLDLQYRQVDYRFLGINAQGQNVTQDDALHFFNPKVGLYYQMRHNGAAYASFAVGQREPNRNDYTENTLENRPKPEKLYNTELGYKKQWTKAALGITAYHMFYHDQLAVDGSLNDVGEYKRINIDRSYRLGLEITGGFQVLPGLQLEGNAALSRNKVDAFTEYIDVYDADGNWTAQQAIERTNTDLAFSPAVVAGAELRYDLWKKQSNEAQAALRTRYISKQYLDNASDDKNALDAYSYTDFQLRYAWRPSWARELSATLLVQNIFNALYESNGWSYRYQYDNAVYVDRGLYPQAGTNFLVGVSLGF